MHLEILLLMQGVRLDHSKVEVMSNAPALNRQSRGSGRSEIRDVIRGQLCAQSHCSRRLKEGTSVKWAMDTGHKSSQFWDQKKTSSAEVSWPKEKMQIFHVCHQSTHYPQPSCASLVKMRGENIKDALKSRLQCAQTEELRLNFVELNCSVFKEGKP